MIAPARGGPHKWRAVVEGRGGAGRWGDACSVMREVKDGLKIAPLGSPEAATRRSEIKHETTLQMPCY